MGMRYEWTNAPLTGYYTVAQGAQMGDGVVEPGHLALVLGEMGGGASYVIEGRKVEVALLLGRCLLDVLQYDAQAEEELWAELGREPRS